MMSLEAFLPPLIQGVEAPAPGITPGAVWASPNGLRPFNGISSTLFISTTIATLEVEVDN